MLLEIAITLIMANILNFLFEKFKQPGVIGDIVAGIILGPCFLGSLSGCSIDLFGTSLFTLNLNLTSPEFKELAFIGIVFLLFITGLETNIGDLKKNGLSGILTAIFSIIIPLSFGFIFGFLFNLNIIMCIAIGAIFFATSITITMRILTDMDKLSTNVGLTLQTAGIFSDIIGLFIFSLIIGQGHPFVFFLRILIFFVLIIMIDFLIIRYAVKKGVTKKTTMLILSVALIVCFLCAALAEDMGLAAIIGAFTAGLIIKKTPQAGMMSGYIKAIGHTFFIPLFFVWIGASFNFHYLWSSNEIFSQIFFIVIFVILCLFGNFIGGMFGARLSGLTNKESFNVGLGMMPVMGMGLVIVTSETERGIFGDPSGFLAQQINTATFMLIIVSSLVTPVLLKRSMNSPFFKKKSKTHVKLFVGTNFDKLPNCFLCKNQKNLYIEKSQFLFKLLLISMLLQIFLISINFGSNSFFCYLVAIVSGIMGSYMGYVLVSTNKLIKMINR